jgi:hypothetical protein
LACPFFVPTEKWDGGGWLHPSRLPLGGGWLGYCTAPGHEQSQPGEHEIREFCNLGYAAKCSRLPKERPYDAVRFSVVKDNGSYLLLSFVGEAAHLPIEHHQLEYDTSLQQWTSTYPDSGIQKMAECFVQAYLQRRPEPVSSANS